VTDRRLRESPIAMVICCAVNSKILPICQSTVLSLTDDLCIPLSMDKPTWAHLPRDCHDTCRESHDPAVDVKR
jgi:hypothetical protein